MVLSFLNRIFRSNRFSVCAGWLIVVLLCNPNSNDCFAGNGTSFKLPQGKKRAKNGIIAEVDYRWTDGMGCRPLRLTLRMRKTNRDRTLRVDVLPNSQSSYAEPLRVSTQVEIPAGERVVTETIFVQQDYQYSNSIRLEFFEDGRKLSDLSMKYAEWWSSNHYNNGQRPCVLFVDSDAPSLYEDRKEVMAKLRKEASKTKKPPQRLPRLETVRYLGVAEEYDTDDVATDTFRDVDSLRMIDDSPNLELLHPMDVPESYVGLNSIDLMVFSMEDLETLAEDSPVRFAAIDDFVRNSGNLIVYGSDVDSVSALFQQHHVWEKTLVKDFAKTTVGLNYRQLSQMGDSDESTSQRRKRVLDELSGLPDTFGADHGMGRIVLSTSKDPFLLKPIYWTLLESEIGSERLSWQRRHGVEYNGNNSEFWDFLIPGYGATPVVSFLTVIAFFVICIGPINFVVLKRTKRFYLLPFTVAAAAIATTTAMMVYALLSDGVTQRARLRSFTTLEEKSEGTLVAATHCRHAYLAAVAPLKGLVFPERTLAFAISAQYEQNPRKAQRVKRNSLKEYHRGYIGSRSTSQLLTTNVTEVTQQVSATQDENGKITSATNDLGVFIKHAWLVDGSGNISYAKDCESGQKLNLEPIDKLAANKAYKKLLLDNRPEPPKGLDKTTLNWGRGGTSDLGSARLETEMSDSSKALLNQHPGTYLIVTQQAPPFLTKGLEDAVEEAGFHVIRGRWSP